MWQDYLAKLYAVPVMTWVKVGVVVFTFGCGFVSGCSCKRDHPHVFVPDPALNP